MTGTNISSAAAEARDLIAGLADTATNPTSRSRLYAAEIGIDAAALGERLLPPITPHPATDPAAAFHRLHHLLTEISDNDNVDALEVALCHSDVTVAEQTWTS